MQDANRGYPFHLSDWVTKQHRGCWLQASVQEGQGTAVALGTTIWQQMWASHTLGVLKHKILASVLDSRTASLTSLFLGGADEFAEEGLEVQLPVDQLAPGGFLHALWDLDHRPPSPAGSWSTSPLHTPQGHPPVLRPACVHETCCCRVCCMIVGLGFPHPCRGYRVFCNQPACITCVCFTSKSLLGGCQLAVVPGRSLTP